MDEWKTTRLFLARAVRDYLLTQDWLNSFDKLTLASLRYDYVCRESRIGEYRCYSYMVKSDGKIISVDTSIRPEIEVLDENGIRTIGCCCGHGVMQPYIQVAPEYVQKMHELGYEELPVDEHGNGKWCFKPKTYLPFIGENKEKGGRDDG